MGRWETQKNCHVTSTEENFRDLGTYERIILKLIPE
jgi:hypothetical protein